MPPHIVSIVIGAVACETRLGLVILPRRDDPAESSEVQGTMKEIGTVARVVGSRAKWVPALILALVTAIACHRRGGDSDRDGTSGDEETHLETEACLGEGHEERAVDVDGDQRPDLTDAYDGDRRICTAFDMNFDGRIDLQRFYEEDGESPRLELHDFDFDGRVDEVALFEGGERVRAEYDTDFDDRMDLQIWCEHGQPTRVTRHRSHRSRVDTWERYEDGLLVEARYDEDGDGEPERIEVYRDGRLHIEETDRNGDGEISDAERSRIEDEFAGTVQRMSCDRNAIDQAARARSEADSAERGEP